MIEVKITYLNQIINDDKKIGIAQIPFLDLKDVVAYTRREDDEEKYYQRAIQDQKILDIKFFILKQINKKINEDLNSSALGTFPTSTIIAINSNNDYENLEEFSNYMQATRDLEERNNEFNECFLIEDENSLKATAFIPKGKSALIVDGQHRLYGITKLYEDVSESQEIIDKYYRREKDIFDNKLTPEIVKSELEDFDFLCSMLVNFDVYDQSRVFADVNFNQKSVNKSLFYDIFGTYPDVDNNEIVLAHEITELFFTNENSVFNGNIKMLGGGPGLFSQSFFVESLLKFFKVSSIWGSKASQYLIVNKDYSRLSNEQEKNQAELIRLMDSKQKIENEIYGFLNNYFEVVLDHWNEYVPIQIDSEEKGRVIRRFYNQIGDKTRYDHVLLKTIGIGALMKYIELIYRRVKELSLAQQSEYIRKLLIEIDKEDPNLFSNKSVFKGGSGFGTRNRIFYDMFFYTAELLNKNKKLNKDELNILSNIVKDKNPEYVKSILPNLHNDLAVIGG
ncbi:DGQHR domain-containing protein [Flagellimonas zhangzhouensis]|uniref:DGQHR domain-containing protein n=1 Tax=Flagellimonas zhangzhouensis TaxID=1073328 RepID=A0A1H2SIW7_9FLAO|nr:DGQHR domain-containing protein [Allomuricauda zhangzhouensis]SDQ75443.1 DGQHR domain-containing protein [Allomuricauda zhangzhouensis]SDW31581.1 DGQHR domain-containing protein [Allomuricauda zhangzhouensis]